MRDKVKSQVCGGKPSEKPESLARREYSFHIERSDGGDVLVIIGVDGKTQPDYYRREAQKSLILKRPLTVEPQGNAIFGAE